MAEDKDGWPPPKLSAKQLRLYQNGKRLKIVYFQRQAAAVGVLVDTSKSLKPKLTLARQAAEAVIRDLGARDQLFLVAFTGKPYLLQPFTADHAKLIGRLKLLRAFGKTTLYDSLADGLMMVTHNCIWISNRAIVMISDGRDTASGATLRDVVRLAAQLTVPIYGIGIGSSQPMFALARLNRKPLDALAKASRGKAFILEPDRRSEELNLIAGAIARRIDDRYVVGFIGGGSTSSLRFEAPGQKGTVLTIEPASA